MKKPRVNMLQLILMFTKKSLPDMERLILVLCLVDKICDTLLSCI